MEQKAHDVFARVAEREEPPLGFTADDVLTRGRRQARTRRAGRVVGGALGTLAATAVVLPLVSLGSGGHHAGPGTAATSPAATPAPLTSAPPAGPDPVCVADLAKFNASDGHLEGQEKTAALQACPVLKQVNAVLDPEGTHLWASSAGFQSSVPADIINGFTADGDTTKFDGVEAQISWTPGNSYPYKNNNKPDVSGPYVQVWTMIRAAGGSESFTSAPDHRNNGQGTGDPASRPTWSPPTVSTLKDGSTVSLKKEQDSAGAAVVVTRTLPSGAQLILFVNGPFQDPGTNTLPFTDQQLLAAVNVSGIEGVQLPINSGLPPMTTTPGAPSTPSGGHS